MYANMPTTIFTQCQYLTVIGLFMILLPKPYRVTWFFFNLLPDLKLG